MADPASYRPKPGEIPTQPGVYRFRDAERRVIYVGKAKSLRPRLSSYFQDVTNLHPRTQQMVTTAASVEWTVVSTEVEALALEYSWIKEFDPRFNVKYRDDKSYPWLAVTVGEEYPRVTVMRGTQRKGVRYFGPYGHAWAIRDTVDTLLRVFPMRSCSAGVFRRSKAIGRPCLLGDIGKCAAPCVDRVSAEEHRAIVNDFLAFMGGQTAGFTQRIHKRMQQASEAQEYELAAKLRDDLGALNRVLEKQTVVLGDGTDADVLGFVDDLLEVAVQIFSVRGGRIRGQRGWVADKSDDAAFPELVQRALMTLYEGASSAAIPRQVLVPRLPADHEIVAELLAERRGGPVQIRVPQRGDKKALMQTVEQNAKQSMMRHKMQRSGDLTARSKALEEIQEALDLPTAPLRIECYDISNLQGTEIVASMVVFEDGLPRKSEYRRFTVRHEGQNDVAAMHEVITRRFERLLKARAEEASADPGGVDATDADVDERGGIDPETGKPRRFAYAPALVVVDGGPPQVAAAHAAMTALGIQDIALVGLAKRLEEVWLPEDDDPVILPRTSEGLYLLQRLRDEAHRFAISHHRGRRSKSMVDSLLDPVPGLGPTRRKALMKTFGSVKKMRAASVEEMAAVPGIGPTTAESIVAALAASAPAPAVNTATGEIMEDS